MKPLHRTLARFAPLVALFPSLALAHPGHPGHDFTWDFNTGFSHPWSGADHLLAMIAVGIWAVQLGGRSRWLIPAAFIAMMSIGAVLGRAGGAIPGIEQGIAASVFALGLLVATARRVPLWVGMTLTGFFALFHGYAHGVEIPSTAAGFSYGIGFVCATASLHAIGLGLGTLAGKTSRRITAVAGCAIAAAGLLLLAT